MQSNWKKREKQIEKELLNTNHMYGSVKGIAGNAMQSVPLAGDGSGTGLTAPVPYLVRGSAGSLDQHFFGFIP